MLLKIFAVLSAAAAVAAALGCSGLSWLWIAPLTFVGSFLGWLVLAFLFLWAVSSLKKPEEEEGDNRFYRRLVEVYIESILMVLRMKVDTRGLEKTPEGGRFLLVCNHLSLLDVLVLLYHFRGRELTFITKQENMDMFIIGKLMTRIQCLPLNRENDREALKTILKAIAVVKENKASMGLFPEGTRSLDGKLHHFRSGGFKIAQKCSVPIVICTIRNTQHIFRNFLHGKATPIPLHLVEVISPEELKGVTTVDIANRVHAAMATDLGPELVAPEEE